MAEQTLSSSIQINDGLSPAIRQMAANMEILNRQFANTQRLTEQDYSASNIKLADVNAESLGNTIRDNGIVQSVFNDQVNQLASTIGINTTAQNAFTTALNGSTVAAKALLLTLAPLALAAGALFAIMGNTQAADEYTQLRARLDLMNDGLQTTQQLNDKIFQSAQRARGSYMEMADNVAKLGILAGDAFKSNDEMIFFAEQLNKQFKIGGAGIQEQTAAMYQLTQAMASGKLQGDEFRSIMENAPLLAQAISKEMGIPMGQLKVMASKGAITAEVIKNALINSADETDARFAQIPPTFAEVGQQISNIGKQAFGDVFAQIGSITQTEAFQGAVNLISNGLVFMAGVAQVAMSVLSVMWDAAVWGAQTFASVAGVGFGIIEALLPGIIVGLATYAGYMLGTNLQMIAQGIYLGALIIKHQIHNFLLLASVRSMNLAAMAQGALNAIMAMNPIGIVVMLLGLLIGGLMATSIATNGLRATMASAWSAMVNTVGWAINGMIDKINVLIGLLNSVGGVLGKVFGFEFSPIQAIGHVDVSGIDAAGQNFIKTFDPSSIFKDPDLTPSLNTLPGSGGLNINSGGGGGMGDVPDDVKATKGHADRIAGAVDNISEDLSEMRTAAEREAINKFTTAQIHVEVNNQNTINNSDVDIDGIGDSIGQTLLNTISMAREGI